MSDIVERVKSAIAAADDDWNSAQLNARSHLEVLARAAIKATVKHLMENVSENMVQAAKNTEDFANWRLAFIAQHQASLAAFLSDFEKQGN